MSTKGSNSAAVKNEKKALRAQLREGGVFALSRGVGIREPRRRAGYE